MNSTRCDDDIGVVVDVREAECCSDPHSQAGREVRVRINDKVLVMAVAVLVGLETETWWRPSEARIPALKGDWNDRGSLALGYAEEAGN